MGLITIVEAVRVVVLPSTMERENFHLKIHKCVAQVSLCTLSCQGQSVHLTECLLYLWNELIETVVATS